MIFFYFTAFSERRRGWTTERVWWAATYVQTLQGKLLRSALRAHPYLQLIYEGTIDKCELKTLILIGTKIKFQTGTVKNQFYLKHLVHSRLTCLSIASDRIIFSFFVKSCVVVKKKKCRSHPLKKMLIQCVRKIHLYKSNDETFRTNESLKCLPPNELSTLLHESCFEGFSFSLFHSLSDTLLTESSFCPKHWADSRRIKSRTIFNRSLSGGTFMKKVENVLQFLAAFTYSNLCAIRNNLKCIIFTGSIRINRSIYLYICILKNR